MSFTFVFSETNLRLLDDAILAKVRIVLFWILECVKSLKSLGLSSIFMVSLSENLQLKYKSDNKRS